MSEGDFGIRTERVRSARLLKDASVLYQGADRLIEVASANHAEIPAAATDYMSHERELRDGIVKALRILQADPASRGDEDPWAARRGHHLDRCDVCVR
jgi:hypothetical protein